MDLDTIKAWIEHWEGRRNQTYDDKTGKAITPGCVVLGHPTVGVGFNLDANGAQAAIEAPWAWTTTRSALGANLRLAVGM